MKLSKQEIEDLIDRLKKGEVLPYDYKYKLFPVKQKEYELVYGGKMRREDILANEDGIFPVPLQVAKIFNGDREEWKDGWRNIIAFGDNLQFLKTIYENKDPLIKDKVKGKVKLIYIDPPFGADQEFEGSGGQHAYNDKKKSSEFVEFLRRRLVLAKELLSNDGSIYVHLDQKMVHYIKIIMDEIFGKSCFRNTVIWHYGGRMMHNVSQYNRKHDVILYYSRNPSNYFFSLPVEEVDFEKYAKTRHEKIHTDEDGRRYLLAPDATMDRTVRQYEETIIERGRAIDDVWEIRYIRGNAKERTGYPTQKPEELLARIIKASSEKGDIVMDFFSGSGVTAATAEKLGRKWISCDIGKLSFYTVQKRLLNIQATNSLEEQNKVYKRVSKSFITVNTGYYDLSKIFDLKNQEYIDFVMNLFEIEPKKKTISGIQVDGEKKDGYNAIVWQYWKFRDSLVDEDYLHDLHNHIGAKAGKRVYIIAPASYVDFISDYYEIDKVRYYFLKVPYHIIRELHKVQFKKFRQPQSKSNLNDLEDAIGFHFMRQPEVKSDWIEKNGEYHITIKKFLSDFSEEDTERDMENFESLAMVLIDKKFDGETFDMDTYYFAEDLLPKKKKKKKEVDEIEDIKEELKHTNQISLPPIPKKECGKKLMVIYVDIYGNEFKEEFKLN